MTAAFERFPKLSNPAVGRRPGHVAPDAGAARPAIGIIAYGPDAVVERHNASLADLGALRGQYPVVWVNIEGLGDAELILAIGDIFGLHDLALEDVVNTHQRPKLDEYDDHLFLVMKMMCDRPSEAFEQMSMFLGKDYLLTFQETPGDCLDRVRERIRSGKGRMRKVGADYLCYAIVDGIVDAYFPVIERQGEMLESVESSIVQRPRPRHISILHQHKRSLLQLRRVIWQHREMLSELNREDHRLIAADTRPFLRDVQDHSFQLLDIVETYREIASGLLDVYISSTSARLNEIMKVLTVITTVFMPLTFIAGIYGMNFDRAASPYNMPELGWRFGYVFALGLMLVAALAMLFFFWRNGWLGNGVEKRGKRSQ